MGACHNKGSATYVTKGRNARTASTYIDETDFRDFQKANLTEMKALNKASGMQAVKQAWYDTRENAEKAQITQLTEQQAVDIARATIPESVSNAWFRNADSDAKPKLVEAIMTNKGTMNAGWNIAYQNYVQSMPPGQKPMSFNKWANTPQTLYRGTHGQDTVKSDIFLSYTPNKAEAQKFGNNISTIKIKPIDTWGSYQTTGEQEYLIPIRKIKK